MFPREEKRQTNKWNDELRGDKRHRDNRNLKKKFEKEKKKKRKKEKKT